MATTFKTFLNNDIATTRTLLHEAIPITGTIISGTYQEIGSTTVHTNIKDFAHGMFQSVYDYPYLSSSANHLFDITCGYSTGSALSASTNQQNAKKVNIYNQMAKVLVGHDVTGNIQRFDQDGNIAAGGEKMDEVFFLNFSRLLTKDEIKKGSFAMTVVTGGIPLDNHEKAEWYLTLQDHGAETNFKVGSPTGEYGLLLTSSTSDIAYACGHVYYQAGIAVLTASVFAQTPGVDNVGVANTGWTYFGTPGGAGASPSLEDINATYTGSTIQHFANSVRNRIRTVSFNNTTELNSTIYFCRANHNDYNYSSNPTYLSGSKVRVKGNNPFAEPASYITTVGLYSSDNELLAVAKLSEPLKKTPSNELTLRVRLDY
jgi:hypothetical protein